MKKKHPEHVNLERWLVSYADFITLLFAFFVIMYATAKTDSKKFKTVADSIRAAFGGQLDLGGAGGGDSMNLFDKEEQPGGRMMNMPAGKADTMADPEPGIQEVKDLLEETIGLELGVTDPEGALQMMYDSRGLVLRLGTQDLYDPGEVVIREDFRPLLDRVGRVLLKSRQLIRIEGHTDDKEVLLTKYPSSWELASARAAWVVRYWVKKFEFDPRRLGAAGYANFRPVANPHRARPAAAEYAKAANRRIEIVVLNTQFEGDGAESRKVDDVSLENDKKREPQVGDVESAVEPAEAPRSKRR